MRPTLHCIEALVGVLGVFFLCGTELRSQSPAALSGVVSSQEADQMEGVLVSAKREGSNVTLSVVSDNQGRYSFLGSRLQPGDYQLNTRAPGYDLDNPGVVKVEANKTTQLNLRLQKTKDLAAQMTPADWFLSNPEIKKWLVDDQSLWFPQDCAGCHSLAPIMTSKYQARMWPAILRRMASYDSASINDPGEVKVPVVSETARRSSLGNLDEFSRFLASINLSSRPDGTWPFELKTMPRPSGRGTKVVLTEYQLPRRESQPHDVVVDRHGMVWYNDHGNQYIGKLNPQTGEVKEWLVPGVASPEEAIGDASGRPHFERRQDNIQGDLWFGNVKVNVDTDELTVGHGPIQADGMVWRTRSSEMRLQQRGAAPADADMMGEGISEVLKIDPKTGETVKRYSGPTRPMSFYGGVKADSQGNLYGSSLHYGVVGIMNGQSGEWAFVPAPSTTKNGKSAGPRRNHMDAQDRFWYAQYYSGGIGVFDPKSWTIKEWPLHPYALPYGIGVDKNGEAWAAGKGTDYLYRLNPATGEVTTYWRGSFLYGQSRQLFVDNTTTPVTVWVGHNHKAAIVRVQPLD